MIPFNKPYLSGNELVYIRQAIDDGKISGNGMFTKKCHAFFELRYGFKKSLLTHSCTAALEMAALLAGINPGDEVIIPSFAFPSTANAFVLRGARIIFADSLPDQPNLDAGTIESLITPKTKAIVVLHYAGVATDMDPIFRLAEKHNLFIIEDAAQAIESFYKSRPLGSIGHMGAFSFHETKNIISGEGGMLTVNNDLYKDRAEVIWEKGTNRAAFFRGETDKYSWTDIGSSFLPSEIIAAFLLAQTEHIDRIQHRRTELWDRYFGKFKSAGIESYCDLPQIPSYATNNGHMFYLVCHSEKDRDGLIGYLKQKGIMAVFHYQSLHKSPFYITRHDGRNLPYSDKFSSCLVRIPLFFELTNDQSDMISEMIMAYFRRKTI